MPQIFFPHFSAHIFPTTPSPLTDRKLFFSTSGTDPGSFRGTPFSPPSPVAPLPHVRGCLFFISKLKFMLARSMKENSFLMLPGVCLDCLPPGALDLRVLGAAITSRASPSVPVFESRPLYQELPSTHSFFPFALPLPLYFAPACHCRFRSACSSGSRLC